MTKITLARDLGNACSGTKVEEQGGFTVKEDKLRSIFLDQQWQRVGKTRVIIVLGLPRSTESSLEHMRWHLRIIIKENIFISTVHHHHAGGQSAPAHSMHGSIHRR